MRYKAIAAALGAALPPAMGITARSQPRAPTASTVLARPSRRDRTQLLRPPSRLSGRQGNTTLRIHQSVLTVSL